jgi:DNA-binding transcriptional MerR regulator
MAVTVSEVAGLARVSVRTLHHYDSIGLLRPSARSCSGYRLYDGADLERLQRILYFRELGFSLDEIREVLDDPGFDPVEALVMQRELLLDKAARAEAMIQAVDRALEAAQKGIAMDEKDMFEVFGDFHPGQYQAEAHERWGDSDAYKESSRRTSRYSKEDWKRIRAQQEAVEAGFAEAMKAGKPADGPEALALAERARLAIDTAFYPCSRTMHANLGRMYVADPRFAKHYEDRAPGLARYVCDAILANETFQRQATRRG